MSSSRLSVIVIVLSLLVALALPQAAVASVISGGDTGHTTAPVSDPGWNRVGKVGTNGSGIYLGNGWVLTANHVSSKTTLSIDTTTYDVLPGLENTYRLRNTIDTADIDLYMFRVDVQSGDPLYGVGDVEIATSLPGTNGPASIGTHIGTGEGQTSPTETHWYVDTTPVDWVWSTIDFAEADADFYGYSWAGDVSRATRWDTQKMYNNNYDFNGMEGFATDFRDTDGYGMVADNDSGSPMFFQSGGTWYLSGTTIATGGLNAQPSATGVYGNLSLYADLTAYRPQILTQMQVPEPGTLVLLGLGGIALLRRKRRK